MPVAKRNLPTYAIVELLMRLAKHNASIGEYKTHKTLSTGVRVRTSGGNIVFDESLIMDQFHHPEHITDEILIKLASAFKISGRPFQAV